MKHLKLAAALGRNGDTEIAHLTPGEVVIPKSVQTPEVRALLAALLDQSGHDLGRYTVGGSDDSRNPKTGAREFFSESDPMGDGASYGYGDNTSDASRANSENATNSMVADMNAAATAPMYEEDAQKTQYAPRSLPQRAFDWARNQPREFVQDIKDKPLSTLANIAMPGVFGAVNNLVGMASASPGVAGRTLTDRAIDGFASFTGFNGPQGPATQVAEVDGKTTGAIGPSGDKVGDKSGEGGDGLAYNPAQSGPSGSGMSPLAQALAGMGIRNDGWNNWGRRKTLGPLASSYDPNGRQYVTPWDYRG